MLKAILSLIRSEKTMKKALFLLSVATVMFNTVYVSHAENLNYMASGQETWDIPTLQAEISRTESVIAMNKDRLKSLNAELAKKVALTETAAGSGDSETEKDHYMGH